jgi:hypothetical protein
MALVKIIRKSNSKSSTQDQLETEINTFLGTLPPQNGVINVTITHIGNDIVAVILYSLGS